MMKSLLGLLLLFIAASSNSQTSDPLIVVKNNGDTLYATSNYAILKNNIQAVKVFYNNQLTTYTPTDIKSFYFTNQKERYVSKNVSVDQAPAEYQDAYKYDVKSASAIETTAFLYEIIKNDSLSLYSYNDKNRVHFYYEKMNEKPVELIYHYTYENSTSRLNESYKQQLTQLTISCYSSKNISSLLYREAQIKKTIIDFINCAYAGAAINAQETKKLRLKFGVVAGAMYNSYKLNGDSREYSDNYSSIALSNYKSNVSPVIGVSLDFALQKRTDKLHLVNELIYKNYTTSGTGFTHTVLNDYTNKVEVKFSYLQLNNLFRYHITTSSALTPFINAGIGSAFMISDSKNTNALSYDNGVQKTYTAFDNPSGYEFCGLIGAGLSVKNFKAEARGSFSNGFSSYVRLKSKVTSLQLLLTYQF